MSLLWTKQQCWDQLADLITQPTTSNLLRSIIIFTDGKHLRQYLLGVQCLRSDERVDTYFHVSANLSQEAGCLSATALLADIAAEDPLHAIPVIELPIRAERHRTQFLKMLLFCTDSQSVEYRL